MRSNFRPDIRLTPIIPLVIFTFSIVLNIAPIAEIYNEKNLYIKYLTHQIDQETFINRLKIVTHLNQYSICHSILKS